MLQFCFEVCALIFYEDRGCEDFLKASLDLFNYPIITMQWLPLEWFCNFFCKWPSAINRKNWKICSLAWLIRTCDNRVKGISDDAWGPCHVTNLWALLLRLIGLQPQAILTLWGTRKALNFQKWPHISSTYLFRKREHLSLMKTLSCQRANRYFRNQNVHFMTSSFNVCKITSWTPKCWDRVVWFPSTI